MAFFKVFIQLLPICIGIQVCFNNSFFRFFNSELSEAFCVVLHILTSHIVTLKYSLNQNVNTVNTEVTFILLFFFAKQ